MFSITARIGRPAAGILLTSALAVALPCAVLAAPPALFSAWGTRAPDCPPAPEGWTEVRSAGDVLPALTPNADEQRRGCVVFLRDAMAPIAPDSVPAASERAGEIRTFAARGQYEPLSVGIYALEALDGVKVSVGELRSAAGQALPADGVDVRVARAVRVPVDAAAKTYRLDPCLLEKQPAFSIEKARCAQVWVTLHVPQDAKPGEYRGEITVQPAGKDAAQVPVTLRVLPFVLPPVPIEMGLSFPNPGAKDEMLLKELTDMREHGINTTEPQIAVQIATRDQNFGDDDVAATIKECKRVMNARKKVYGGWNLPVTFEAGHQIAFYWDKEKGWFAFWPHSEKIDNDFIKAVGVVTGLAKAEGWPALRCYAQDEAGAHNLLDEAVYLYKLLRERAPGVSSYTTIGGGLAMGHDELGKLTDVCDLLSTNRFTPEIARFLVDRKGKPYGVYNGCGYSPAGARFFFGFYGWKTAAQQILQWAYSSGEGPFQGQGFRNADEGFVYHAPDGPIPSPMWEGIRSGTDDYRYLSLLWAMADAAQRAPGPAAPAANDARQLVTDILGKIPWSYQAMRGEDRTPPPPPATLRKWRWEVAQRIMKLQAFVPALAEGKPLKTGARSPFDFDWHEPAEEPVAYGQEMLPLSDFEAGMKPWMVQAWTGKGVGVLDPAQHHSGAQSVRIDNPADGKANDVSVLVWATWAGGGLNVKCEADRVYEFSAWVKVKDRNTLPDLRFNLPAGACRTTKSGRDKPTADGWQRVWTRMEMAFHAEPNYIGLWLQGPGTAWADDLSLREVTPPALDVSLDQEEYDGQDRAGVFSVSLARRMTPATVRFTLAPKGGQPVASLAVPFQAQAGVGSAAGPNGSALSVVAPVKLDAPRFVFDPSVLAPGAYEAKAELLDGRGAVIASKAAGFRVDRPL